MSKRSFRIALIAVISSIVVVGIVAFWLIRTALAYPDSAHEGDGSLHTVEIRAGMSFPAIARALSEADVIERPTWVRLYAMWRGVTSDVKSGTYVLADNLTLLDVLDTLPVGVKEKTVSLSWSTFCSLSVTAVVPILRPAALARLPRAKTPKELKQ